MKDRGRLCCFEYVWGSVGRGKAWCKSQLIVLARCTTVVLANKFFLTDMHLFPTDSTAHEFPSYPGASHSARGAPVTGTGMHTHLRRVRAHTPSHLN
jgi:hypothetical protein